MLVNLFVFLDFAAGLTCAVLFYALSRGRKPVPLGPGWLERDQFVYGLHGVVALVAVLSAPVFLVLWTGEQGAASPATHAAAWVMTACILGAAGFLARAGLARRSAGQQGFGGAR